MQLDVYDTYARTADGTLMHFDVLVPKEQTQDPHLYATQWLDNLGISDNQVSLELCRFCHSESSVNPEIERRIARDGYFILQMEGCPSPAY